jgi:transposase
MAQERLSMRKTKEILRLYYDLKLSKRQVARSCNIAASTVREHVRRAEAAGIKWPLSDGMDDAELSARLFPEKSAPATAQLPVPSMERLHQELRIKGVTRQLLWLEYKEQHPDGYQYSQFCELYRAWTKHLDVTLRQEYKAGEKMFVDFAGKTVPIINPATGEVTQAQIFVAILGASNYTYALAVSDQGLSRWITAHVRAFQFFGGTTEIIVPDNLKSGVSRPCRYEPDVNATYLDMAQHYGTAVIPARAGKPRDKAKVEAAVLFVTRWILAALRHHTFFSIPELNAKIAELLQRLNMRKFRKLDTCRKDLFEAIERATLKPLPPMAYEYREWKWATVNVDYHIDIDSHYYSAPHTLTGQTVGAWITARTVELLRNTTRIALHPRSFVKGGFTTDPAHRPKAHQKYLEWTPSRIVAWAEATGPRTAELVAAVMKARPHPEQGYRSCLGILRLEKRYGKERLEAAANRALAIKGYSYKSVASILKTGLDQLPLPLAGDPGKEVAPPRNHRNVRGSRYYN